MIGTYGTSAFALFHCSCRGTEFHSRRRKTAYCPTSPEPTNPAFGGRVGLSIVSPHQADGAFNGSGTGFFRGGRENSAASRSSNSTGPTNQSGRTRTIDDRLWEFRSTQRGSGDFAGVSHSVSRRQTRAARTDDQRTVAAAAVRAN